MTLPRVMPMTPADLDEIMPLERRCFKDPWTRHMYLSDLTRNDLATYLVLRSPAGEAQQGASQELLAYGGFWLLLDEAHIATIAAHPRWRSRGLGLWLMLTLLDAAILRGASISTLEVRVGNTPARRMYEKVGFAEVGERRNYYRDGEDALIMTTPPLLDQAMQERLSAVRTEAAKRIENCFGPARSASAIR